MILYYHYQHKTPSPDFPAPAGGTEMLSLLKGEIVSISESHFHTILDIFGALAACMLLFQREFTVMTVGPPVIFGVILALAVAATVAGGAAPVVDQVAARAGLWRVQAFRSGILIAVAFGDVLPEAWRMAPGFAGWGALAAFVFCYTAENIAPLDPCHEASEDCHSHPLGKAAIAGLFLHSFFDGVNLGAAAYAGTPVLIAVGAATILHKLADGFTISTMMSGDTPSLRHAALAVVALATPIGALSSSMVAAHLEPWAFSLLLAFAGGSFVYIGAAEVLPRLHRREHGDASSLASFSAGLITMLLMRQIL